MNLKNEKRNRKIGLVILGCASLFPPMLALLSWKKPIIYDGDYTRFGMIISFTLLTAFITCGFFYRYGGTPNIILLYKEQANLKDKSLYVVKLAVSFVFVLGLYFLGGKALVYPSIKLKFDNEQTQISFRITDVSREDYTQNKNEITGYSYYHNKEIWFPWSKHQLDKKWVGRCIVLVTDGNQYGKIIQSIKPTNCPV